MILGKKMKLGIRIQAHRRVLPGIERRMSKPLRYSISMRLRASLVHKLHNGAAGMFRESVHETLGEGEDE